MQLEQAIRKYGDKEVRWSLQGMLRLTPVAMERLFRSTLDTVKLEIHRVLVDSGVSGRLKSLLSV